MIFNNFMFENTDVLSVWVDVRMLFCLLRMLNDFPFCMENPPPLFQYNGVPLTVHVMAVGLIPD